MNEDINKILNNDNLSNDEKTAAIAELTKTEANKQTEKQITERLDRQKGKDKEEEILNSFGDKREQAKGLLEKGVSLKEVSELLKDKEQPLDTTKQDKSLFSKEDLNELNAIEKTAIEAAQDKNKLSETEELNKTRDSLIEAYGPNNASVKELDRQLEENKKK